MQTVLSPDQAQKIKEKLSRLNLWKKKEAVVKEFSINNCEHIGQLDIDEATRLLDYLVELEDKSNNMRKKMLSMGYDMFFDEPKTPAQNAMERKDRNFKNVSAWCESSHSKHKKPLRKLDPFELVETVTQFEQVLASFKKSRNK